jgi:lipoyl(octanoyl) transferase
MTPAFSQPSVLAAAEPALQVYLLGLVDFEAALTLQRRLVYDIAGDRSSGALILCEHAPLITIGRQGSWGHVLCSAEERAGRRWPVRWVNRGGGCLLHLPGQLAIYPILALDRLDLGVQAYLDRLHTLVAAVLADFSVRTTTRPGVPGVWVGDRPVADVGVAVRSWVSYYGAALNINPDLEPFRLVQTGGPRGGVMTSLERERHGPLRPALVRERLVECFAVQFGFARTSLFFDHPVLMRKARRDVLAAPS